VKNFNSLMITGLFVGALAFSAAPAMAHDSDVNEPPGWAMKHYGWTKGKGHHKGHGHGHSHHDHDRDYDHYNREVHHHHHYSDDTSYDRRYWRRDVNTRRRVGSRKDESEVRDARRQLARDLKAYEDAGEQLRKDRAELEKDKLRGAGRKEIYKDHAEIRSDVEKINEIKERVRQSRENLERAKR